MYFCKLTHKGGGEQYLIYYENKDNINFDTLQYVDDIDIEKVLKNIESYHSKRRIEEIIKAARYNMSKQYFIDYFNSVEYSGSQHNLYNSLGRICCDYEKIECEPMRMRLYDINYKCFNIKQGYCNILFENGYDDWHNRYNYNIAKEGKIPFCSDNNYLPGALKYMKNGSLAVILRATSHICTIQFLSDGLIRNGQWVKNFLNGSIAHPNIEQHNVSSLENYVKCYLLKEKINYKFQFRPDDLSGIDGGKLSYDFAIFDDKHILKYLIECQGKQHYQPVELFGGELQFKKQQQHDALKREFAKSINIKLIEISYAEDSYDKVEILLNNALKLN